MKGWYARYGRPFVYWRALPDDAVGIVPVLHRSMDPPRRLGEDSRP